MLVQTALERVDVNADLKAGGIDLGDLLQGEGDGARKIVADGLHVDAVLEHDVKVDREAVLVGGNKHALAEALAGKQAHALGALELLGHTDDAVARHRGITGNIGNNVVRDAQAAVNGLRHKNLLFWYSQHHVVGAIIPIVYNDSAMLRRQGSRLHPRHEMLIR